ncbi:helicase HerA domain-containing protein [Dyella ginsengisoli]|uniref:helicase HerA domain-containing protein n=1 Tax=Dyella ginsengisoli TaxID=363848 RepID=UPI0003460C03|nr:DUF87 domain-containing protein [Dyella ginsengisoli]
MTASIPIGIDFWESQKRNVESPIIWDELQLSNPHVGIAGTTGAGKTFWIKRFIAAMPDDVEVDIFDIHGDIDVPGAREVLFSESTRYGFNLLSLNPDPHYGGVRRAVSDMLHALGKTSSSSMKLGDQQAGVLRHLLTDTYALRGIFANSPATWARNEITEAEAKAYADNRDWASLRQAYPHLSDVVALAKRKLKALWLGVDDSSATGKAAMSAFDECSRAMWSLNQARKRMAKMRAEDGDLAALEKRLEAGKEKAIAAFSAYVTQIETGREFDDVTKYQSKDTLTSVITRLENLMDKGIFNPNPPPFGDAMIRRYNLKPVSHSTDELRMFVNFRLSAIVREMKERGESRRIRRMVVLDECKNYLDEDPQAPINVIATEMRKFGLMIVQAGQSPAHWSQDFIKSAGTLMLLNLATVDWDPAIRKLKIEQNDLRFLRPQQTGAVRMLEKNRVPAFRRVQFQ